MIIPHMHTKKQNKQLFLSVCQTESIWWLVWWARNCK